MPREGAVVVLRLSGNFGAEPGRTLKSFVFMVQLDLGDDEACIVAPEHVHFPRMLAPGDDEAGLFNQAAMAQWQERLGV